MDGIRSKWENCSRRSNSGLKIVNKVKAVKSFLKVQLKNRIVGGNESKKLEVELVQIELLAEKNGWSTILREERLVCLKKLWKQIRIDEQKWRQFSRIKWLKDSDRNLKFFHMMTNVRRKANFIGDIIIEGKSRKGMLDQIKSKRECFLFSGVILRRRSRVLLSGTVFT
ncbi:hypothetical protein Ddye_009881 [Dipteronia dyeriana]|uniref:Uncharacterized protein n=1 Tax=Dipteronia dyeriana TaxID=168575 RepID=A0AAE0CMT2_9ROSI|nr:hypothetical protein Ddye_009881 [Dipteronia dyeriana]